MKKNKKIVWQQKDKKNHGIIFWFLKTPQWPFFTPYKPSHVIEKREKKVMSPAENVHK